MALPHFFMVEIDTPSETLDFQDQRLLYAVARYFQELRYNQYYPPKSNEMRNWTNHTAASPKPEETAR